MNKKTRFYDKIKSKSDTLTVIENDFQIIADINNKQKSNKF